MKSRELGFLFTLLLLAVLLRPRGPVPPLTQNRFLLDTVVTVTAYGRRAPLGLERAWAALSVVGDRLDPYRPGSELWRLNRSPGRWVRVSPVLYGCLQEALAVSRRSGGAFDPTVWPLTRAWGFGAPPGRIPRPHLPSPADLSQARALVNYRWVQLKAPDLVRLDRPGMGLDLGGIAKGYAADLAGSALRRAGVNSALIDVGESTILALGSKPGGGPWKIALERPRGGGFLGYVELSRGALGTSGDYQDFFTLQGRRYSHIFDPRTGWPARTTAAVTVRGRSGSLTDAGGTAAFVLGPERGMALLKRWGETGLFVSPRDRTESGGGFGLRPWRG